MFPQTQRVRLVSLCVGVTEPLPFLPSGQAMETTARAHKQTTCPGNHPRSTPQKPMFRTSVVTCSRTHQGMDPDGLLMFSPKKSPKKPINRMCLGEESTDDPHTVRQQHRRLHTVRQQHHRPKTEGASKVVRDGDSGNSLRQSVSAQSTWSGCEVELGTCHCLPYYVHLVHTRVPWMVIADDRESILCGGDPPRGLSDETTSLGTMATAMERKPTPALSSPRPWTTSARRMTSEGQQGCGPTGRTARILTTLQAIQQHPKSIDSKLSNSIFPRHWMSSSSTCSGGPVTRSKWTHQWMSGVTMLVRWLCSSPASALLAQVSPIRSSPASGNAPLGNRST